MVFNASRSRGTILLGVSNYSVSFIGGSSKLFNLRDIILIEVSNYLVSFIGGSFKLFNLGDTALIYT